MAPVNPAIQPNNPQGYGANSRPVDTPDPIRQRGVETNQILPKGQEIGDRSAEYLGQAQAAGIQSDAVGNKGWGDLFSNIVGIGDFLGKAGVAVVKKDIENQVYEIADKERQEYTKELEGMLNKTGSKTLLDSNASMDEVPDDLRDLPEELAVLESAKKAGKITKLDYQGRLLEKAKGLRSQHQSPELRQFIDEQFAKVTGQNPANARINSLITTLNQQAAGVNSEQNKVRNYFIANQGIPAAEKGYAQYSSGQITANQFYAMVTPYKQKEEEIKMRNLERQDRTGSSADTDIKAKKVADVALGSVIAMEADRMAIIMGIDSPEKIDQLNVLQTQGKIGKPKWDENLKLVSDHIARMEVYLPQRLDKEGVTADLAGGIEERNKRVKAALEPMYRLRDRIVAQDFGGMGEAARDAKLILDQGKLDFLKGSKSGPIGVLTNTLKDLGGEEYTKRMALKMTLNKDGIPDAVADWYKGFVYRFNTNGANPNESVTIKEALEEAKTKGINSVKATKGFMNEITKIGMKYDNNGTAIPDNIKEGLILSAFHEKNRGMISMLNPDGVDPQGRPIRGQAAVFQSWTTPEITSEIKRLSKNKPELWSMYETWARDTFATELVARDIQNLGKIVRDPNIRIDWSSENKRFEVSQTIAPQLQAQAREDRGGTGYNTSEAIENKKKYDYVKSTINRINSGLYNLKNVALEGNQEKDIDGYLLQAIANGAGTEGLKNVQGIPVELLNKIMLGRAYGGSKR